MPKLHVGSGDVSALQAAAERFYSAETAGALRQAVEQARAAGPESTVYHELAGELAILDDREAEAFSHFSAVVLDRGDDDPRLHIEEWEEINWSRAERNEGIRILEALVRSSADPHVKSLAANKLAMFEQERGETSARDEAVAALGWMPPMAIIGTWDNDQGKGFDTPLPPESGVALDGRYAGAVVEIGWRPDAPRDERGGLPLLHLMSPDQWAIAYAASAFKAPGGEYALWLTTTDPIKVWVNDELVFEQRLPIEVRFDQIRLPVTLRAGVNRLLVKSAHREKQRWRLVCRVTARDGAAPVGLEPVRADVPPAPGASPGRGPSLLEQLAAFGPKGSEARTLAHRARWARLAAGHSLAVQQAEAYSTRRPRAIYARIQLALALWDNADRGRASDLLADLDRSFGGELDLLTDFQARYWVQQGMLQKARDSLTALTRRRPDRPRAWRELAELFAKEGWTEERCDALQRAEAASPSWPRSEIDLAQCEDALGFPARAEERYRAVLRELPARDDALDALRALLERKEDYGGAARLAERRVAAYPYLTHSWSKLAEVRRRAQDPAGAEEALRRAIELDPDASGPRLALAHLALQRDDRAAAAEQLREALARRPADEAVANRLDFLAPAAREPWEADAPNGAALEAAVYQREKLKPEPGANVAFILDHEVMQLNPDGSTSGIVTHVIHAFNQQGRDTLLKQHLSDGRTRILHAYAVDPQGHRVEPDSIRGREVFFRGLGIGSTVVLQYRRDVLPNAYLAKHLAMEWWFQAPATQSPLSQLILWRPSSQRLHETIFGPVAREERVVGDQTRVAWTYAGAPAVTLEPNGPSAREVLANVHMSTIPDWDAFLSWEDALLQDAFRDSPELDLEAKKIVEGARTPTEKLERIHAFLMDEIRYQQDYENPIAGVRPHPASTVLERRYGDCKDKAVAFITLARLAGLEAQFALIRTRPQGPVDESVPMQQFNHAVVYVPVQPGLAEGRFFDSTADALDLDTLRWDDVGTQALVYDPKTRQHAWRKLDFQPPERNLYAMDTSLSLRADGSGAGEATLSGHGATGSWLRVSIRNERQFEQTLQQMVNEAFPGARIADSKVIESKDVSRPAQVHVRFEIPNAARIEDGKLRMKLLADWSPKSSFELDHRRTALLHGTPFERRSSIELRLPEGARVAAVPKSGSSAIGCLDVDRTFSSRGGVLSARQVLRVTCERTSADDYPVARQQSDAFLKRLDEELVVEIKPEKATAPSKHRVTQAQNGR